MPRTRNSRFVLIESKRFCGVMKPGRRFCQSIRRRNGKSWAIFLTCLCYTLGRREPHKAVLQIDDPIEEKIRIEASRMIERLGVRANYRIWGMYPLQHVVLNPELYPDSDLYYGPNIKLDVSMIRKIISQSRRNGTHAVLDGAGLPKSSQEVDR